MEKLKIVNSSGIEKSFVINNPYEPLPVIPKHYVTARHKKYVENILITFDIETSRYMEGDKPSSFMYHWQMSINNEHFVFGRTWKEFLYLMKAINFKYANNGVVVCYVHFLSFEYQFIRDFLGFTEVFATAPHKILIARWQNIEFRCSYILSNMSLEKWTIQSKCEFIKTKEIFDYDKVRTSTTLLTYNEKLYCFIDVYSLYECVITLMNHEHDNIATIPYTSTGYVRRHAKSHMLQNKNNWKIFNKSEISEEVYNLCKLAFRGGNTSANRFLIDSKLEDINSYDIKSSYPYQMYSKDYPTGQFMLASRDIQIKDIVEDKEKAFLIPIEFNNLNLKTGVAIPYISYSKCRVEGKYTNINGRLTRADKCFMVITEVDLAIILQQYTFDSYMIGRVYCSAKNKLPDELIDSMLQWFIKKCELNSDPESEEYYFYMRSKNYLNAYYGMFVTDIVHAEYIDNYKQMLREPHNVKVKPWLSESDKTAEMQIHKYYNSRNNFLHYPVGIWVTAYARQQLQELIDIVGMDTVYVDTDSNKHFGDYSREINKINKRILQDTFTYTNREGEKISLGVWEKEKTIKRFKTLGAKKYYCEYENGKNTITVSGLSKTLSLNVIDSIDKFNIDTVVDSENSGRATSYYNNTGIHWIYINGERILTASNIGFEKTTYTLGLSTEFEQILRLMGVIK